MNPLQQAAKEYAKDYIPEFLYGEATVSYKLRETAFLAGAEYVSGAFAEWAADNEWHYWGGGAWLCRGTNEKTTAQLMALYKQFFNDNKQPQ